MLHVSDCQGQDGQTSTFGIRNPKARGGIPKHALEWSWSCARGWGRVLTCPACSGVGRRDNLDPKNKDLSDIADMILPYLTDLNIKVSDRKYLENILSLGIDRDYNLKNIAKSVVNAKINGINISIDSLDREKFKFITGKDKLEDILIGLKVLQDLNRLKLFFLDALLNQKY